MEAAPRAVTTVSSRASSRPAASIVVPSFRRPHFLREALASALAQSRTDIEVLVCDNGGDAATAAVVASAGDPRVRHVVRDRDLGMHANAIDGFRRARGTYVLKLDDDDILEPTAVERLLAPLEDDPAATLAFASFVIIDEQGRVLADRTAANEAYSGRAALSAGAHRPFDRLVTLGAVGLVCAAVRRDAVDWDDVPPDVATAYDRHIALQAARDGARAWFVDEPLARYRVHAGSDTLLAAARQTHGSLRAVEHALDAGRHEEQDFLLTRVQVSATTAARALLRDGRPADARSVLRRALRRAPTTGVLRLLAAAALPAPLSSRIMRRRLDAGTSSVHDDGAAGPPAAPSADGRQRPE